MQAWYVRQLRLPVSPSPVRSGDWDLNPKIHCSICMYAYQGTALVCVFKKVTAVRNFTSAICVRSPVMMLFSIITFQLFPGPL